MCTGHSATTDNDHHTADNQLSRCCKLHADWSVRNVTEYDSLLMITRSLCGHAIIEIGASARLSITLTHLKVKCQLIKGDKAFFHIHVHLQNTKKLYTIAS